MNKHKTISVLMVLAGVANMAVFFMKAYAGPLREAWLFLAMSGMFFAIGFSRLKKGESAK